MHTKRNFRLISFSKELSKWWRMAFIWLWSQSWLLSNSRFWLMQLRWLVTSWQQNMECLCKYRVYRVEILQGWCAAWTTYCDSGCDSTIATSSLPDLYLPKIKDALFVAPEFNGLSWGCADSNVHIRSHPLNEQQEQINNTSWKGKTLILPFKWRGPGAYCVPLKMSQRTYHGTLWWF